MTMNSEIDQDAFLCAMSKHNGKTFTDSRECFQHFVQCYESARAPRTISVDEFKLLDEALYAELDDARHGYGFDYERLAHKAISTLGITVRQ